MNPSDKNEKLFHSGYVAIIGRPNVGKSTLLNQLSGLRVAIVSPKPQTTRHNIRAIIDEPDAQIIFIDTPGMHKPKTKLGEYMVDSAYNALNDADVLVLMVDATAPKITDIEKGCCERALKFKKPLILLINKTDLVSKQELLPTMERFMKIHPFVAMIPISVKKMDGLEIFKNEIRKLLPEGPRYFPLDTITDQTERTIAAELIREQILRLTNEEIPHGTAVEIELFEERYSDIVENEPFVIADNKSETEENTESEEDNDTNIKVADEDEKDAENVDIDDDNVNIDDDNDDEDDEDDDEDEDDDDEEDEEDDEDDEDEEDEEDDEDEDDEEIVRHLDSEETGEREFVKIQAVIFCEKESHKRILIGKGGEMIKRIGIRARKQIEEMLQCKIYLELHVKVREDWRNQNPILDNLGYKNKKSKE